MKNSSHNSIIKITLVALFAAISYVSLMLFFIPVGPMYIHFGNMIIVIASLLIGGVEGGLAGSVGMGLYDILNGFADSSPKTFLLKFLIGITVGFVFKFLLNKIKLNETLSAIIAATLGMIVNLIGETAWKTVQFSLAGSSFKAALSGAVLAQLSTAVNAVIAVVGGVALYKVLKKPIGKIIRS